jgi:hypothetical protein
LGVLLIVASAIGVYNVVCDNTETEKLAQEAACGGGVGKPSQLGCSAQKTMMERTPIGQTFEFATNNKKQQTVTVKCRRSAVLVGEYACELR